MDTINLLDIHSPQDIKKMDVAQLNATAAAIRSALIRKLAAHGGHVGPNLGMVEATIALHYVFNAPTDKIVFDVSHQAYTHKMLTGRMPAFVDAERYDDVTGYTDPHENSEYDLFSIGHTSTSISLATGLAKARDLAGSHENVVAVIGDGSLGGGMALEGLDFGATLGTNFIVVVNDNEMSIAENHGGLYADLRLLRHTNGTAEPNIFRAMGYSYRYVEYGNDIARLIKAFEDVKDINHPVVVHIHTMKGLGLPVAEAHKERFHWSMPFDPETGAPLTPEADDYTDIFARQMLTRMASDHTVTVLTAGTPGAIGFTPSRRRAAGKQFVDVGICEQQAVGMAAGMAKGGMKPMVGVAGTFLQRAYDQLSHDLAINNLPAALCIFHTGIYGIPDETHLGFFDIPFISNIPNILYLTPTCSEEYSAMLDWALDQTSGPVAVRTPGGAVVSNPDCEIIADYSQPRYMIRRGGDQVAIVAVGSMYAVAEKAADILRAKGYEPTLINPRNVTALDTTALDTLAEYRIIITAEDGILDGGYGQKVAAYLGEAPVAVRCLGLKKEFLNEYNAAKVAEQACLTPEGIASTALSYLER